MIDVNWDLAPEGAVAIKQDQGRWKNVTWINDKGEWWDDTDASWNPDYSKNWAQTIAVRPVTQTKTVADAVEYCRAWKSEFNFLFWYEPIGFVYRSSGNLPEEYQLVCTRKQFEAYVKEQEGERWTHEIRATGEYCYISEGPNDSGQVFIKIKNGIWDCLYVEQLKPIKPTIGTKEAIKMMSGSAFANWTVSEFMQHLRDDFELEG